MIRPPFLVFITVLAATACATGPHLTELTPWSPPYGQECGVGAPHGDLAAVLDSAALTRRIEGLAPADGMLLMSLSVDSGRVERLRVIESSMPRAGTADLVGVVNEAMAPAPDTTVHGRLIIRVTDGAVDTLTLGAYQFCRPRLRNGDQLSEELQAAYERINLLGKTNIWMYVDSTGAVEKAEIHESSGKVPVDEAAVMVARMARFIPARLDRYPMPVWVALDFNVAESNPTLPRFYRSRRRP